MLVAISWHGVGRRTVAKMLKYDMKVVHSICPDIVVVQLGTNDLSLCPPLQDCSVIENFVHLLHDYYDIQFVCVRQTICRCSAQASNKNRHFTRFLRVLLEPIPYAIYWGHRGFWKSKNNFFTSDGIRFNSRGQYKLYRSLRGAVLKSLQSFVGSMPSNTSLSS